MIGPLVMNLRLSELSEVSVIRQCRRPLVQTGVVQPAGGLEPSNDSLDGPDIIGLDYESGNSILPD